MKKLLLSLLMLLSFVGVQAQTFFSDNSARGDSAIKTGSSGDIYVYNMIRAASGTVDVQWSLSNSSPNLRNNTWSLNGVCDNVTCIQATDLFNGNRYSAVYGATSEDFHVILNADNAPVNSTAWLQINMKDKASSSSRTLTFIATKTPLGITTTVRSEDNIKVFPNPARESVNVVFESSENIKTVGVYNLLGQPISMFHIVGNSANIPLNDAPAGVYFLRMFDGQGKIVATRRFTRQ